MIDTNTRFRAISGTDLPKKAARVPKKHGIPLVDH
jgi:hypothetical protein